MLTLDFINVGNGDSILVRELREGAQRFAMLVDCGHDNLIRDDHPTPLDPRSRRIYAGDFLKQLGVAHLDVLLLTHFHRDHVGGLGRVLEAVTVGELLTPYLPPEDARPLEPDGDNGLVKAARNVLRCVDLYAGALRTHPGPDCPEAGTGGRPDRAPGSDGGAADGHPLRRARPLSPAEGGL